MRTRTVAILPPCGKPYLGDIGTHCERQRKSPSNIFHNSSPYIKQCAYSGNWKCANFKEAPCGDKGVAVNDKGVAVNDKGVAVNVKGVAVNDKGVAVNDLSWVLDLGMDYSWGTESHSDV